MSAPDAGDRRRPGAPRGRRGDGAGRALPHLRLALAALALGLLLLPGCRLLVQEPTVRILNLELTNVGFASATAEVRLEVENPNWFELDILGFDYVMDLSDPGEQSEDPDRDAPPDPTWVTLTEGYHDERLTVPAGQTRELEMDVPFDYEGMGAAVRSFLAEGSIPYRLRGEVEGRLFFWTVDFPFDAEGAIQM